MPESWDNGEGTRWFHEGDGATIWPADSVKIRQILHIWPVLGLLCLDSVPSRAISPANPARDFLALFVFARA
jgi:hypothetical protein